MPAKTPTRRAKTARELADQFGSSDRTIRRLIAEPRDKYETRAASKRQLAQKLRTHGLSYKEIADEMDISIGSVSSLLYRRQDRTAS